MYQPHRVEARSVGEDVTLAIGNWSTRMHFEAAILLAAWMDECARDAKAWSGTRRATLRGVGTLHDASDPRWLERGQPYTPNGVYPVARERLKVHEIAVASVNAIVRVTFKGASAEMPWQAALQIAQFIRLKAKESQQRAGDTTRHWSKIVAEHEQQQGPGITRG